MAKLSVKIELVISPFVRNQTVINVVVADRNRSPFFVCIISAAPGVLAKDRLLALHAAVLETSRAVGDGGISHGDVCERVSGQCSVASVLLYFEW
jgi:hypothetical protein